MDVLEALQNRHSVRAFLSDRVPRKTLENILVAATRAPSWANSQPWEFVVATGEVLERIKERISQAMAAGEESQIEVPWPREWPAHIQERIFRGGEAMYEAMGIAREDRRARREFRQAMNQMAGAPQVIFVCMERTLGEWSMFDLGAVCQSIMLAAQAYGLDTCPAIAFVAYPRILRDELGIRPEKKIVVGIAIGRADPEAPVNRYHSHRVPLEEIVAWHGF